MSSERSQSPRVNYLDWLRVLAVAGVFVFHATHPFDTADWHVKNAEQTDALLVVLAFLGSWGLAFFFLIAGAGSCLALRWRTSGQYVNERLTRLLLPLLVAYALFSPLQYMIEERHDGGSTGSILGDARSFVVNTWDGLRCYWRTHITCGSSCFSSSSPCSACPCSLGYDGREGSA